MSRLTPPCAKRTGFSRKIAKLESRLGSHLQQFINEAAVDSRLASVGVITSFATKHCEPEDFDIHPQAPVPDVVQVVFYTVNHLAQGVRFATPAVDLGPASDAWLDLVA